MLHYRTHPDFLLVLLAVMLLSAGQAMAIPAFSRQHKTECTTCHTIYPELNEFGEAFLKNSYVWPGKPKANSPAPAKNEGLWLAGIPEAIPVSFTASLNYAYDKHAADNDDVDFTTRDLRLQAGGAFREAAGFFATYNLYAQGSQGNNGATPDNIAPNINELFLVWRHALDTPLNVKIGRFEPKLGLWKKSNKVIVVPSYAPHTYKVGSSQFSVETPEDALEINGIIGSRLFLAGGVVDRNGQNAKEGYGHISYRIGGTDFLGHEPAVDLERDSIWDFLSVTIGGYGYFGRNATLADGIATNGNDYYRAGGDLDILYKRLHLRAGGVAGRDSNPNFNNSPELESHAVSAEGEYMFGSPVNLIALFRYEYVNDGVTIARRYIPAITYSPIQNAKLMLQYNFTQMPTTTSRVGLAVASFSF